MASHRTVRSRSPLFFAHDRGKTATHDHLASMTSSWSAALDVMLFAGAAAGAVVIDRRARPRGRRGAAALAIQLPTLTLGFACVLLVTGSAAAGAGVILAATASLVVGSNAKFRMLGEPVCFSDAASLRMMIRHPRFYVAALPPRTILALLAVIPAGAAALAASLSGGVGPRLIAVVLASLAAAVLRLSLRRAAARGMMVRPDLEADVARWGLIPTLAAYTAQWWRSADPPAPRGLLPGDDPPVLVVVVQCESFVDPAAIPGLNRHVATALPGLARARAQSWRFGALAVSGFGAYTMRTEYGVLFGRSEQELGFRRFDPYLTAAGERAHALPSLLGALGYHATFLHPYPLEFYDRTRLMPAIGFRTVLGPDAFGPAPARVGPYIADACVAARIGQALRDRAGPQFIYAVTMENHGPHGRDRLPGCPTPALAWAHHLGNADRMLDRLVELLSQETRSSLLVFLGDHRPFLAGVIEPKGGRTTPYVVLGFDGRGNALSPGEEAACTPAGLHALIVGRCARVVGD